MKRIYLFAITIIAATTFCTKDDCDLDFCLDCEKLRTGIYNANLESFENNSLIKVEIDKLTKDLTPNPGIADYYGHLSNMYKLFGRLDVCQNISFSICCYSCIQTGKPQTEVSVCIDSSGVKVCRIFDLYTSGSFNLEFAGAHKKTSGCGK